MKLNPDCIRNLMLFLEEKTTTQLLDINGHITAAYSGWCPARFAELPEFRDYTIEEILYHTMQLSENGYIVTDYLFNPEKSDVTFRLTKVFYLTPKGHDFAANIRNENHWKEKIKPVFSVFGTISLSIIGAVAEGITTAIIDKATHSLP